MQVKRHQTAHQKMLQNFGEFPTWENPEKMLNKKHTEMFYPEKCRANAGMLQANRTTKHPGNLEFKDFFSPSQEKVQHFSVASRLVKYDLYNIIHDAEWK